VRNDMGDGWLWVTSKSTGLSGIVNRELVKDLVRFVEHFVSQISLRTINNIHIFAVTHDFVLTIYVACKSIICS